MLLLTRRWNFLEGCPEALWRPIPSSPSGRAADAPWNTRSTSASRILGSLDMQIIPILQMHHENNPGLLDSSLNHSVLAGFMAGAGHVALEDQRRLNFVKLLKEAMILREHMCAVIQRPVVDCRAHRGDEAVLYLVVPAADAELSAETVTGGTIVCTAAVLKQTQLSIKPAHGWLQITCASPMIKLSGLSNNEYGEI